MEREEYVMHLINLDVQTAFKVCRVPNSDEELRALRECQRRKIRLSFAEEAMHAANLLVFNDPRYDLLKSSPSRHWAFISMGWGSLEAAIHWTCASVNQYGFGKGEGRIPEWRYVFEHRQHMSHPEHRSQVVDRFLKESDGNKIELYRQNNYLEIRFPWELDDLPNRSIGHVLRKCMDDADDFLEEKFAESWGKKWIGPSAKQLLYARNSYVYKFLLQQNRKFKS